LSGGTISTGGWGSQLIINNTNLSEDIIIRFSSNGAYAGGIGYNTNGYPIVNIAGVGNYNIIHSGNIGSQSVASANMLSSLGNPTTDTFADYVNAYKGVTLLVNTSGASVGNIGSTDWVLNIGNSTSRYGRFIMSLSTSSDELFWQSGNSSKNGWGTKRRIAFTDSNVASATKLQTVRTIWGQSFDGTANVSGNLNLGYNKLYIGDGTDEFHIGWGSGNLYHYRNFYGHYFSTRSGEIMRINSSGNVGIGTTSPQYKLDVDGTFGVRGTAYCTMSSASEDAIYYSERTDLGRTIGFGIGTSNNRGIYDGNLGWIFKVDPDNAITIGNGNNVGFNGSVIASGFIKSGSSSAYVLTGDGGHKAISDFATASAYVKKAGDTMTGGLVQEIKNKWLNQARLQIGRLDSAVYSDRAIIGVTDGNLHLDAYKNKAIYLNYYQTPGTTEGQESTALVMIPSGNVGIGTASPTQKLSVSGAGVFNNTGSTTYSTDGITIGAGDVAVRYITCYGKTSASYINMGYAPSANNCAELVFSYVGNGSAENYSALSLYGAANQIQVYPGCTKSTKYINAPGFVHPDYWSSAYALTSNGGVAHIGSMSVNYANSAGSATSSTSASYSRSLLGRNTSGGDYGAVDGNLVFAEWNTYNDSRWYLKAISYETRVGYANSAGYAANSTYLYASDSPYRYGDSVPYYMRMRYNVNGDSRWYLSVYPETPKTVAVDHSYTSDRASYLSGHSSSPDNSHPGHGARIFYSWDIGAVGNATSGYSNGITIGSHPSDTAYGFQIVQNMWDDRTYTRRYNGGWQSWKTLAWTSDIPTSLPANGGNADTVDNYHASDFSRHISGTKTVSGTRYYKLGTLPASNDSTYDAFSIQGSIGGWGSSTKSQIDICVGRRDGVTFKGYVYYNNSTVWDIGVNSSGELILILYGQYMAWTLDLHTLQSTIDYTGTAFTPSNTTFTLLSSSSTITKSLNDGSVDKVDGYHIAVQSSAGTDASTIYFVI
jgi:hypothetical protein